MCVLQVYEEVEVPVVRLLANTLLPAVSLDAELLTQQLGQTQAALATAQAAASGLAFRAVDLDDRDSCMRALQSVQAVVPQSRPKARGPLSLMQLREVCEKAAAAGNLRAVQMGHFMLQHRQLRDRASHLQSLVETLHSGSASSHTSKAACGCNPGRLLYSIANRAGRSTVAAAAFTSVSLCKGKWRQVKLSGGRRQLQHEMPGGFWLHGPT